MFRTNDSEQLLHLAKANRSQRSLSTMESDIAPNEADMVQRDTGSNWPYDTAASEVTTAPDTSTPPATEKPVNKLRAFLQRVFGRLTESDWERQRRDREEYLAQSVDLYDLEARMRRYDRFAAGPWERGL